MTPITFDDSQKKLILFIFFIILGISTCKPYIEKDKFRKIRFASSGCWGECPIMQLEIRSDKILKFHGIEYVDKVGFFQGKISDSLYAEFIKRLTIIKNKPKKKGVVYLSAPCDAPHFAYQFVMEGGVHLEQDRLYNTESLEHYLTELYKHVELHPADSFAFVIEEGEMR